MSLINPKYANYTTREQVYLFALKDYSDYLLSKFGGRYIEREDMFGLAGYFLRVVDAEDALAHFNTDDNFTKNTDKSNNVVYIGVSDESIPNATVGFKYYVQVQSTGLVYVGLRPIDDPDKIKVVEEYTGDGTETEFTTHANLVHKYVSVVVTPASPGDPVTYTDAAGTGHVVDTSSNELGTIDYVTGKFTAATAPLATDTLEFTVYYYDI